jgi:hypothetical protein
VQDLPFPIRQRWFAGQRCVGSRIADQVHPLLHGLDATAELEVTGTQTLGLDDLLAGAAGGVEDVE